MIPKLPVKGKHKDVLRMKGNEKKETIGKDFPTEKDNRKSISQTRRNVSLTIEEEERLLEVIETFEDLALFRIELTTGIRREDIANIEIGNVDLENRKITFWQGKKRNWHTVPISRSAYPDLLRYVNSLPKGQKKLFMFTGRTAYNKLQYYLKKAKIGKRVAFHDLRRTFIKNSMKRGLSTKAISQITDDKIETIMEAYNNLTIDELREEADKL